MLKIHDVGVHDKRRYPPRAPIPLLNKQIPASKTQSLEFLAPWRESGHSASLQQHRGCRGVRGCEEPVEAREARRGEAS